MRLLTAGQVAPDFELVDQFDRPWRLSHKIRDRVHGAALLLFYPGDWTYVCGEEIPALNSSLRMFRETAGTLVAAISTDAVPSHAAWCGIQLGGISMPVLSDQWSPGGAGYAAVSQAYGAFVPGPGKSARASVLIAPDARGTPRVLWSEDVGLDNRRVVDGLLRVARQFVRGVPADAPLDYGTMAPAAAPEAPAGAGYTLYVNPGCGRCLAVLARISNLGVRGMTVIDSSKTRDFYDQLKLATGQMGVPALITPGGERLVGMTAIQAHLMERFGRGV